GVKPRTSRGEGARTAVVSGASAAGVCGLTGRGRRRCCAFASVERRAHNRSAATKETERRRGTVECILKVFHKRLKAESAAGRRAQSRAQARVRRSRAHDGTGGLCPRRGGRGL